MPANIQVILQQDVDKVGKSGELVRVRPGFARNFLLPRQLAVPATTAAVRRIEHEKSVAMARAEKGKKEARELAAKLSALAITITQKAGEDGRLFGSVGAKDIAAAALKLLGAEGVAVGPGSLAAELRKHIQLKEPIKALGALEVPVKIVSDVTATLKVEVVAK
jgi:large subunit ribosomal protein L9